MEEIHRLIGFLDIAELVNVDQSGAIGRGDIRANSVLVSVCSFDECQSDTQPCPRDAVRTMQLQREEGRKIGVKRGLGPGWSGQSPTFKSRDRPKQRGQI